MHDLAREKPLISGNLKAEWNVSRNRLLAQGSHQYPEVQHVSSQSSSSHQPLSLPGDPPPSLTGADGYRPTNC